MSEIKETVEKARSLLGKISKWPWYWTADPVENGLLVYVTNQQTSGDICDLFHINKQDKIHTKDNAEANAEFIAAAPEITQALLGELDKHKWRKVGDGLPIVGECLWQAKSGNRFYGWYEDGHFYEGYYQAKDATRCRKKYTLSVVSFYLPINPPMSEDI